MSITVSTISTNLLFLCRLYFPELYFRKSEQAHLLGFPFLQDYSPHQKTIQWETEQKTWINIFPKKRHYKCSTDTWKDTHHHSSSGKCKSKPQWVITPYLLGGLLSKRQEITSIIRDEDKKETCALLMNVNRHAMENSMEVPEEIKKRTTIWSTNPTAQSLSKENKNTNSKYIFTLMFTAALFTTAKL